MKCRRCQGLMVGDHFLDMAGGYGEMWAHSLRCVNCGTVYDAVIEQNRLLRQEVVSAAVRTGLDFKEEDTYLGVEAIVRPAA